MDEFQFSSTHPIQVLVRPASTGGDDWQELDWGPGVFTIPAEHEVGVRIKSIDDATLTALVEELAACPILTYLNLSENRNVTNDGLKRLKPLRTLNWLNLSSCSLTNQGLEALRDLPRLTRLDLSYCNRLTDDALKTLGQLRHLTLLNLQGCVKMTNGGFARVKKRGLQIHR